MHLPLNRTYFIYACHAILYYKAKAVKVAGLLPELVQVAFWSFAAFVVLVVLQQLLSFLLDSSYTPLLDIVLSVFSLGTTQLLLQIIYISIKLFISWINAPYHCKEFFNFCITILYVIFWALKHHKSPVNPFHHYLIMFWAVWTIKWTNEYFSLLMIICSVAFCTSKKHKHERPQSS